MSISQLGQLSLIAISCLGIYVPIYGMKVQNNVVNKESASIRIPGGIACKSTQQLYVAGAAKQLERLNLASGNISWVQKQAGIPIWGRDNLMIVQNLVANSNNAITIVAFQLDKLPRQLYESQPIKFPKWVSVSPDYGLSFTLEAGIGGKNFQIDWEAHSEYAGGAFPNQAIVEAAQKSAWGRVSVDLKSGKIVQHSERPRPTFDFIDTALAQTGQPYWSSGQLINQPVVGHHGVALLTRKPVGSGLILKRWNHKGEPRSDIHVLCPPGSVASVDLNRNLLLVGHNSKTESLWSLTNISTGKTIDSLRLASRPHEFAIIGDKILYSLVAPIKPGKFRGPSEQRQTLHVYDTSSNKEQWQHPILSVRVLPALPR